MAPHADRPLVSSTTLSRLHAALYVRGSGADADTGQTQVHPPPNAPAASMSLYLGIGVGVGGAIFFAIIVVAVQIIRKRAQHQRAVAELEDNSEPVHLGHHQEIREVPRPVSTARCGSLMPLQARAGWGALSSDETVHEPDQVVQGSKKGRNSVSLPKRVKQRGIRLRRLKHLSAIMESPRSKCAKSPSPAVHEPVASHTKPPGSEKSGFRKIITMVHPAERDEDVFTAPGSPKPDVLPSFAIRSPGSYGASIANDDRPKPPRSVSVGALLGPIPENAVFGHTARLSRPQMHARSISLGAPPSRPPSGPVPPVPRMVPKRTGSDESNRRGMCVSRLSSSSQESASSSVLVTSPILTMRDDGSQKIGSPSVEQLVADDDSAQLKAGRNRHWQNPLITGPRPMDEPRLGSDPIPIPRTRASIRSNIARYSNDSLTEHRISTASTASLDSTRNRLSIPQIATADRVSISRVSSFNSLSGSTGGGVQKITTPRKPSRQSSVSATGSPAERRKSSTHPASVLREVQANAVSNVTPSRQTSNSTSNSGRSSNGNPFQGDQTLPLMKPSALKGSPNAKGSRGHRRQNCVRISTLTPQIFGPPPSRPTSPSIMCGIQEESADGEESYHGGGGLRFVSTQRLSRPPSASSLGQNLRVQTLKASLTPSSPTLSTWTAYQEQNGGLRSQRSDSQLPVSPMARSTSRQSDMSSAFSIPSFPSPSKATVSGIQLSQPVPEFCLSRPSTDEPGDTSSSPFALHMSSDDDDEKEHQELKMLPSSPPLPVSKETEYDPAWPMVTLPAPQRTGPEYDPASPAWSDSAEPERSSAFFPFAVAAGMGGVCSDNDQHVSPRSRPTSYGGDLPDTPPCSPKSMPEGFKTLFSREEISTSPRRLRSAEKLTSANASTIMATIPEVPPNVGFPSAVPILRPPQEGEPQTTPKARRQRAASNAAHSQPLRTAPPPPIPSNDACLPSPLNIKQSAPQGPRSEPAKSVLKNAMALRRMNSEMDQTRNSRRYTRLGREASPLLPWIGSPDPSESCNDMFDFDFASMDANAGAEVYEAEIGGGEEQHRSALDEIDMTDLDRRLDGALAGFDAGPPSTDTLSRRSSVWEDGEKFWERRPEFTFAPSSPLPIDVTPRKKAAPFGGENLLMTPMARLQMPVLDGPPSSIGKTPKSLYDSDGFLRT